jgi:hypothetical protein
MWIAGIAGVALLVDIDELQAAGNDPAGLAGFLDGMIQHEQQFGVQAAVVVIDEDGALFEFVAVLLNDQIHDGLHQRMGGVDQARHGGANAIQQPHILLLEADSLVFAQDGIGIAGVAAGDLPVALADAAGNEGDFVAAGLRPMKDWPRRCGTGRARQVGRRWSYKRWTGHPCPSDRC